MFKVYCHTCPNGKRYIGITSCSVKKRWGSNGILYKEQLFYSAIQEFGWDNIKHEILFDGLTKEQAEEIETELIKKYKCLDRNYGYNVAYKGVIHTHTDETRQKMSRTRKGRTPSETNRKALSKALTGKKMSAEHIEHLRTSHIGYVMPKEQKEKISKSCMNKRIKKVSQYSLGGEYIRTFQSMKDALESVNGKTVSNISSCCTGRRDKAYGYIWKYA